MLIHFETLTLCHLPVLRALNPFAIVEPDDGGIWQTSHFTFEHSLFSLNHIQVIKRFDEVRHSETLHLILWDLWLLWDRWHLLQFSPKGRTNKKWHKAGRGLSLCVCYCIKITFITQTCAMVQH